MFNPTLHASFRKWHPVRIILERNCYFVFLIQFSFKEKKKESRTLNIGGINWYFYLNELNNYRMRRELRE